MQSHSRIELSSFPHLGWSDSCMGLFLCMGLFRQATYAGELVLSDDALSAATTGARSPTGARIRSPSRAAVSAWPILKQSKIKTGRPARFRVRVPLYGVVFDTARGGG